MTSFNPGGSDYESRKALQNLVDIERGRDKWWWRGFGFLISCSTITAAVFAALSFFKNVPVSG